MIDKTFFVLAISMVITGSINTISTKLADVQTAEGLHGEKGKFDHPFLQTVGMFLGESLCMAAFYVTICLASAEGKSKPRAKFNPLIFALPACCDMTATSLMYVGLNWTYASVFQMLRGAVVIFTGILSMIFLKKKLRLYHWAGMLLVLIGLGFVGIASLESAGGDKNAPHPIQGDIIIIVAQLVVAVQMVVEEKFISKYDIPALQVVGWEGVWGFSILSCLLVPMYFIKIDGKPIENALDGFVQISNSWVLLLAIMGNILSIAFFNFFGISITKYANATTRMVLDSVRTVVIWGFSLIVGWQKFQYFQVIGFSLLLLGTCIYNEILVLPFLGRPQGKVEDIPEFINEDEERNPLLGDEPRSINRE